MSEKVSLTKNGGKPVLFGAATAEYMLKYGWEKAEDAASTEEAVAVKADAVDKAETDPTVKTTKTTKQGAK